jgi:hypothetical protein
MLLRLKIPQKKALHRKRLCKQNYSANATLIVEMTLFSELVIFKSA